MLFIGAFNKESIYLFNALYVALTIKFQLKLMKKFIVSFEV
jgi:hypothetical protein